MPAWTMTIELDNEHVRRAGEETTTAQAWDAVHHAAAELVRAGRLGPITLEVDGTRSTIRPADTGDTDADTAATLEVIESGRIAVVDAHQAGE